MSSLPFTGKFFPRPILGSSVWCKQLLTCKRINFSGKSNFSNSIWHVSTAFTHTYLHNWPLQPFRQYFGLDSHTTHVVCVNFVRDWRDLQFNVDSERQIFEKLFNGNLFYSQSFCQKSAQRKLPKK